MDAIKNSIILEILAIKNFQNFYTLTSFLQTLALNVMRQQTADWMISYI